MAGNQRRRKRIDAREVADHNDGVNDMKKVNEEAKTMAGNQRKKKRIDAREVADHNDGVNHMTKVRKVSGITMMNWLPSYCFKYALTSAGSFQFGYQTLRSQHRHKLRRLLKTFMLQQNWIRASGVLSVLVKGTVRDKSLSRNQYKYWATLELLKKIKGDSLTPFKVQKVYDLWMKKLGSMNMKGRLTQGKLAVQLESMLFSLCYQNRKDTLTDVRNLTEGKGFKGNSIANFVVGLIYYQLWYSTIPEEFQLEELNGSSTPVQSHLSESRTHVSSENSDGHRTHVSSVISDGHDAADTGRRDLPSKGHSSTSVGNEKDNVNAKPRNGSSQDTDYAERSGSEKSFHADKSDDTPDVSIFYTRGLPPWLLPLQLPQSTNNMEKVISSHKDMLNNDYKNDYKDALTHLRAALHLEPPVLEALHPLIQMLLLGDHVTEALNELESVSQKLDTSIYIRLKASLLEYFDNGDNLKLCTHFEDILKKDPTCSHTLAKLIGMHQDGVYSTEEMVEMIGLHLDAVVVGDCSSWKEMASCFYKLSYCESDEISTCYTQDDAKHEDVVSRRTPSVFTNSSTKHTWQLRCRWWKTRHFSHKRLALDIASDDMVLVTYKAAIASYLYGQEGMYSVKATQHLTKENKVDMLAILQMHCGNASSGFCCSSLQKEI